MSPRETTTRRPEPSAHGFHPIRSSSGDAGGCSTPGSLPTWPPPRKGLGGGPPRPAGPRRPRAARPSWRRASSRRWRTTVEDAGSAVSLTAPSVAESSAALAEAAPCTKPLLPSTHAPPTPSRWPGSRRFRDRAPSETTRSSAYTPCSCGPAASRSAAAGARAAARAAAILDDLAMQAADDALWRFCANSHTYRGESRFTTWAYKFALLEAAVKVRRRSWQGREVPLEDGGWAQLADDRAAPDAEAEMSELIDAIRDAIADALTPHQRSVLIAITLNDVPIDVLAEPLSHNARRAVQDPPRRPPETARPAWPPDGLDVDSAGKEDSDDRPQSSRDPRAAWVGCLARRAPSSPATNASSTSTATSNSSSPAATPTPPCRACAPTSKAAPPAQRTTRACSPSSAPSANRRVPDRLTTGSHAQSAVGLVPARPASTLS